MWAQGQPAATNISSVRFEGTGWDQVCSDQVVRRTTKARNNTRNMRKFPEENVTMTHTCRDLLGKTEVCKVGLGEELGLVL